MWSRFKKRFFGGSRKTADDASSLDETIVHACILTDTDDLRKSRQTLKQFAKDDLHAVPTTADKKASSNVVVGGGGGKLRRKLSWFGGAKSRRNTKSMTSLNSDKRRSGDDTVLATKTSTSTAAPETANGVPTSTAQQSAAEPTATSTEDARPSGGVVDSVVRITSSKTSSSLLNVDKSLLVSRDDVWCSRVEFTADKGTFGASCTSHIEELQRPTSLPVSTAAAAAADVKSSPPKLKRRAKAASQSETETRKSRLSQNLPEPDPGERSPHDPTATTTTTTTTTDTVIVTSSVDPAGTTEHLKSNAAARGLPTSTAGAGGKRVPPPVPTRKYPPPPSSVAAVSMEHPPEAPSSRTEPAATTGFDEGQASPSPTRNSPDSGSDDTEGKESGYVTLDDLQAQLMRSSWSSDERDVIDSRSNNAHATSLKGKYFTRCNRY